MFGRSELEEQGRGGPPGARPMPGRHRRRQTHIMQTDRHTQRQMNNLQWAGRHRSSSEISY